MSAGADFRGSDPSFGDRRLEAAGHAEIAIGLQGLLGVPGA
jgi:hypothetical protein